MDDNQKGSASAFATLSAMKKTLGAYLLEAFALGHARFTQDEEEPMRARTFLHHAFWGELPASRLRVPGIFREAIGKRGRSLLFLSYFTDDLLDYLRGFTDQLPKPMDALWGATEGWPGARSYNRTKTYVLQHRWRTDVYFNGRGTRNVGDVRVALATRVKLEQLARSAASEDIEQFEQDFKSAVDSALGNATRFGADHAPGKI